MTDKDIEIIVKPIFTRMFNSNFSACEYGIECYKKGMEYQGIKELAIENDNLIKQVRKLEAQIDKMKCCGNCKYNYCSTSSTIEKDGKILLHKWNEEKRAYCDCGNGEGEKYQLWEIKEK